MAKPLYLFLVLICGLVSVSSYPMNSDDENKEEVVTFPPNPFWNGITPPNYSQQFVPMQPYSRGWPADRAGYSTPFIAVSPGLRKRRRHRHRRRMGGRRLIRPNKKDNEEENNHVFSSLKELENDVTGFRDAMGGVAEALIESGYYSDGSNAKAHSTAGGVRKDRRIKQALRKTEARKEKFENQLLNFFTNYICNADCRRKRSFLNYQK